MQLGNSKFYSLFWIIPELLKKSNIEILNVSHFVLGAKRVDVIIGIKGKAIEFCKGFGFLLKTSF